MADCTFPTGNDDPAQPLLQAMTIPCAMLGFFGGVAYFGTLETDPTKLIMARIYLLSLIPSQTFPGRRPILLLRSLYRWHYGCVLLVFCANGKTYFDQVLEL